MDFFAQTMVWWNIHEQKKGAKTVRGEDKDTTLSFIVSSPSHILLTTYHITYHSTTDIRYI